MDQDDVKLSGGEVVSGTYWYEIEGGEISDATEVSF